MNVYEQTASPNLNNLPAELLTAIQRLLSPGEQGRTVVPTRTSSVPRAKSPKVTKVTSSTDGVTVTLTWLSPEKDFSLISSYNLYVTTEDSLTPTIYSSPSQSPWTFKIPLARSQKIVIQIQTVLWNGQVSDLGVSPTTSVQAELV